MYNKIMLKNIATIVILVILALVVSRKVINKPASAPEVVIEDAMEETSVITGYNSGPNSNLKIIEDIKKGLSVKYNKDISEIQLTIDGLMDDFAKGTVRYTGEYGGGIWHGAKMGDKWELAADGQGPMECSVADKYKFPSDFVPTCIEAGNNLVNR